MGGFVEGCDRHEVQLLPDCVDDSIAQESQVRAIDVLDQAALRFGDAAATGRPGYHPATILTRQRTQLGGRSRQGR